jgi:hypothetical protein
MLHTRKIRVQMTTLNTQRDQASTDEDNPGRKAEKIH